MAAINCVKHLNYNYKKRRFNQMCEEIIYITEETVTG